MQLDILSVTMLSNGRLKPERRVMTLYVTHSLNLNRPPCRAQAHLAWQYFNELSEEITIIKTNYERRLRTLMNQGRPCLPGSPRVWQWRVDDAAERRCFTVLIEDALSGSIYDSGALEVSTFALLSRQIETLTNVVPAAPCRVQYAVLRGPPHLTGIELKERFYQENQVSFACHSHAFLLR